MIHFSCDRCRNLISVDDVRYAITIEIEATLSESDDTHGILEADNLDQVDEILNSIDDSELADLAQQVYQKKKYDLCEACFQEYSRNPLAIEVPAFSKSL